MSDIHILDKHPDGQHRLVFHFAVAAGNNSVPVGAGGTVSWQAAVVARSGQTPVSVLPSGDGTKGTISAAEAANLASGAITERMYSYPMDSGGTTNAQRAANIRAFYAQKKAEVAAEISAALEYFGGTLDEA